MDKQNVAITYGIAAWIVIVGVIATWLVLKQDAETSSVDLPAIPNATLLTQNTDAESSLLKQAEVAFAAGRITRPEGDSALDFYREHLEQFPDHPEAMEGIDRVTRYLVNEAEAALRREDWNTATQLANETLTIDSHDRAARSVLGRVKEHNRVTRLTALALERIEAGQLVEPENRSALSAYQAILNIDPSNTAAKQGVDLIAQRLAGLAQSEAFSENPEKAEALIAKAKEIAPEAAGIQAAEKLTKEWNTLSNDQAVKQDLMAAAEASQAGRLVTSDDPGQLGALDLYRSALEKDPTSGAATAGIEFVAQSLVERAWLEMTTEAFAAAEQSLLHAEDAGAASDGLADARAELAFLVRRAGNRRGEFDPRDFVAISTLTIRRQVQPFLRDGAETGSVELNFTVDETGQVADIEVVQSDNEALDIAAVDALSRWRFEPYEIDGRVLPVRSGVRMKIET